VDVDGAADVGAAHDLGVDQVLDVPAAVPGQHLAIGRHQHYAVVGDFLESPAGRLHPEALPVGVADGGVAQTMSLSPAAASARLASVASVITSVAIGQLAS
jgi:hypothetical protein